MGDTKISVPSSMSTAGFGDGDAGTYGLYPLSALDVLFERTTFVTGWLVEGTIDHMALSAALRRLTEKWRMLAGRLVSHKPTDKKAEWYIRIPLDPVLPPETEYPTFALTTTVSEVPLTDYVSIPFGVPSPSFPPHVFIHPSTPRQYAVWEGTNHPLTCWHLTYFPARGSGGARGGGGRGLGDYTCIGFARSHGMFDGGGASMVMRALVAEMKHQSDWGFPVPPLPSAHPTPTTNPFKQFIEHQIQHQIDDTSTPQQSDYAGMAVLGITGALKLAAWHTRERWWRGARREIVVLPKRVVGALVEGVRRDIAQLGREEEKGGVTTGDVLVAWLLKVLYSKGTSPDTIVNCSNLASFRHLLPTATPETYPHNAFIPLPYPLFTAHDLQQIPLHELTLILHTARSSFALHHVVQGYKLATESVTTFLGDPAAHENLVVSNVSASRILESDWSGVGVDGGGSGSGVGGVRTVCGYRYQITPTELVLTNSVYVAGRLPEGNGGMGGGTVLDVTLSRVKSALLVDAIKEWTRRVG